MLQILQQTVSILTTLLLSLQASFVSLPPANQLAQVAPTPVATISITPTTHSGSVNSTFNANIIINTNSQSSYGVDINRLRFNPNILQVVDSDNNTNGVQISPGVLMPITIINSVDNTTGSIQFSQIANPGSTYSGSGILASITFRIVGVGSSNITFDFTLGNGSDTNVAGLGGDLLSSVSGATYTGIAEQDTIAPSTPGNLTLSVVSSSQINLSWSASTDNVGVAGYRIYRNGTQIATSTATNYSSTGLTASTNYSFTVQAYDAAGNNSNQTPAVSATTRGTGSVGAQSIGIGCTTVYYIDKDCDGYGVGKKSSGLYPLGELDSFGQLGTYTAGDMQDADDSDPGVNTTESWESKWNGNIAQFLQSKKSFTNTSRIFYLSKTGNDSTAAINDKTRPYRTMSPILTALRDLRGGVVVIRGGVWDDLDFNPCTGGNPCYGLTGSASYPVYVMAYPGERVEISNSISWDGVTYWPQKILGNITIDGLIFRAKYYGLGDAVSWGDSDRITLRNNEFVGWHQIFFGNHTEDALIEQNVFHDMYYHTVYMGSYGMISYGANDFNFSDDALKYTLGISPGASYRGKILNNVMYNNGAGGYEPIHINTYINDVVVEGNIVAYSGGTAVGLQSGVYNAVIRNNLFFNNGRCGVTLYLYGPDNQAATLRWNRIENNTIWAGNQSNLIRGSNPGCGIAMKDDSSSAGHSIKDTIIRNNIIVTDNYSNVWGNPTFSFGRNSYPGSHVIENNVIWNSATGASSADRVMVISNDAYPTGQDAGNYDFNQFQTYSSNFKNNIYADPKLISASASFTSNPENFNLRLQPTSPAINAGTLVGSLSVDITGQSRDSQPDIGAYEYNSPGTLPTISSFTASPTSITSGGSSTLSWSVSGATSLSISGIGTVTGTSRTVNPTQTTTYTLTATNSSGSVTANTTVTVSATPSSSDTTPPSTPTGLTAIAVSSSQINLSWTASTDTGGSGLIGYRVERCSGSVSCTNYTHIATTTTNSYSDSGLTPNTIYSYRVRAVDGVFNLSSYSGAASATTQSPPDITPPTISSLTVSGISSSGATISWITNEPADTQVDYGLTSSYGNSTILNSSLVTSHSVNLTGLNAGTQYSYKVKSRDAAGNLAVSSNNTFTTQTLPDTTAPSVPANLTATSTSETQVQLSWSVSVDPVGPSQAVSGVSHYQVFRGGVLIATTSATAYINSGLTPGTSYSYQVAAVDLAGNISIRSNSVSVITPIYSLSVQRRLIINPEGRPYNGKVVSGTIEFLDPTNLANKIYQASFTTDSNGYYIMNVPSGLLPIVTLRPIITGYLPKLLNNVDLRNSNLLDLNFAVLPVGDFNGDRIINSLDFSYMNSKWNSSDTLSDVNSDNIVNSLDFAYISNNWLVTGE